VPVVRATGGLDDTVEQFDPRTSKGTGFKFREYSGEAMLESLRSAVTLYRDNPEAWKTLMRNGMGQDYSWTSSAREYVKVYERSRQIKQQSAG
jgi:starch synthase